MQHGGMNKQKSSMVKGDICALLISLVSITQPLSPSLATGHNESDNGSDFGAKCVQRAERHEPGMWSQLFVKLPSPAGNNVIRINPNHVCLLLHHFTWYLDLI